MRSLISPPLLLISPSATRAQLILELEEQLEKDDAEHLALEQIEFEWCERAAIERERSGVTLLSVSRHSHVSSTPADDDWLWDGDAPEIEDEGWDTGTTMSWTPPAMASDGAYEIVKSRVLCPLCQTHYLVEARAH